MPTPIETVEYRLITPRTARYFVLNSGKEASTEGVIALHGYGQLPTFFIRKFQVLSRSGMVVIAPEALHRYYTDHATGRVGASWMTKEAREDDIADNITYLNLLYERIAESYPHVRWHVLGFSQGAATACRWMAASQFTFESLVLYASVFPPDFDFSRGKTRLANKRCLIALGNRDEYLNAVQLEQQVQWLNERGISPEVLTFEGGHEVLEPVLTEIYLS